MVNLRASMACMLDRLHQCGGGRQAEEQEAGVASEGGGEDEGGEGDAVGDQDDWENPSATRANNVQLSSREFV